MPIKLPELQGTSCVTLSVCGNTQHLKKAVAHTLRGKPMVAKYQTPARPAYVRLLRDDGEVSHWHVDCSLDKDFPPWGGPSKVTHALARVLETLQLGCGLKMRVSIGAHFVLPFAKLHETGLVRAFSFKTKIADTRVALTGARFSLTGSPIRRVSWYEKARNKEKEAIVDILAQREMQIDEDYLQQALNWIDSLAKTFVLGEHPNG